MPISGVGLVEMGNRECSQSQQGLLWNWLAARMSLLKNAISCQGRCPGRLYEFQRPKHYYLASINKAQSIGPC